LAGQRIVDALPTGRLFLTPQSHRPYTGTRLDRNWKTAMIRAAEDGLMLPGRFVPRRLRATFNTLAEFDAGVNRAALNRYMGRAPVDIMARHYERLDVEKLRTLVVVPFEALLARFWQNSGNWPIGNSGQVVVNQ